MAGTSFVVYITCRRSAVASGPELGDNPVLFTKHREQGGCLRTSADVAKKGAGWRNSSVDCRFLAGLTRTSLGLHLWWRVPWEVAKKIREGIFRGGYFDVIQKVCF